MGVDSHALHASEPSTVDIWVGYDPGPGPNEPEGVTVGGTPVLVDGLPVGWDEPPPTGT